MGKAVTGAVAVLSRFSEGGVDPFTTIVGQLVCREFKLGRAGADLFLKILSELRCYSTMGDVVYFGFGIDSMVRNLSASYEGGVLVLLSAALAECYHENQAANILWELVQAYKPVDSSDRTPSPTQWLALVRQCGGVLATDEFPKIVEHFMQLCPQNRPYLVTFPIDPRYRQRGVSHPDSIAEALLAVGKVSTGQIESITITGGADAGWLAAVADRFFNLKLVLYGAEGDLLFKNFDDDERAQIEIFYELAQEERTKKEVEVSGKLYLLRDRIDIVLVNDVSHRSGQGFGRVPWENVLSLTFGPEFDRLIESQYVFGTAIGAVARIFDAVARVEDGVLQKTARNCTTYFSFGRGQGFVTFATLRFPELLPLKSHMKRASNASFEDARGIYESNLSNLKRKCQCGICKTGVYKEFYEQNFCLVILTETIIVLLRILSGITVPEQLRPVIAGMKWYYERQMSFHRQCRTIKEEISQYGQMAFLLELPLNNDYEDVQEYAAVGRLVDAAKLFTGRKFTQKADHLSAISVAGICIFLDILTDISDDPEALGRCTVIPGKIEMAGRSYEQAEDISDFTPGGSDYLSRRKGRGQAPHKLSSPSDLTAGYDSASIAAQPAIGSLKIGLLAKHPSSASVLLGPAKLTNGMLEASGLIRCKHIFNRSSKGRLSSDGPVRRTNVDGGHTIWEFQGSLLSKMVAYSQFEGLSVPRVWRHQECLPCCVKAAPRERQTLIIMDHFDPRPNVPKDEEEEHDEGHYEGQVEEQEEEQQQQI
jgi:hypothetical protein